KKVIDASIIKGYNDPSRPRVKTWCRCSVCKMPTPKSYMKVDHIEPVVPIDRSFNDMSLDETADRMWCDEKNLQAICDPCHLSKSTKENKLRRDNKKKEKQNVQEKQNTRRSR